LEQNWLRFLKQDAVATYNLALVGVNVLFDDPGNCQLPQILNHPEILQNITLELDTTLGL
jgi:hypothetical protein